MTTLKNYTKKRDFLICVDSDGCAMDTMDIKHQRCFGPCLVQEWGLQKWEKQILERWNEINLYTMTRGINRFKGLAIALAEIDGTCTRIEGLDELTQWTDTAPELSNGALEKAAEGARGPALAKALAWSRAVNAAIDSLPESSKHPFSGAAECLAMAHDTADVAVVSSANREAVEEEWTRCGMLDSVDILCCQDSGSKAACIAQLKEKGYAPEHILMVGDAPGDLKAAEGNGVCFYPILVRQEAASWAELQQTAWEHFRNGTYGEYGARARQKFFENLGCGKAAR